jgi:hypothetical protein
MPPPDPAPDVLAEGAMTVLAASRFSGLGRTVLYERMAAGELAWAKVGQRRLVCRASLTALLRRHLAPAGRADGGGR